MKKIVWNLIYMINMMAMMNYKTFLLLFIALILLYVPIFTQVDSAWSVYHGYGIYRIFPSSDGKYLYCNENDLSRFVKIDAMTGKVIDSVSGKGMIEAISPDWKYIYTRYGTFESIKKLDINTYQAVDSIDNMQDLIELDTNGQPKHYSILEMGLTSDNRLVLSLYYNKYIILVLAATNMEILDKKLRTECSRGLDLLGSDRISISPKLDYFVANYGFSGFDSLNNIGYNWNETWIWDYKTMKPVKQIFSDSAGGSYGARYPLAMFGFSPDVKYFVLNRIGKFIIYNPIDFSKIKEIDETYLKFTFDRTSKDIIVGINDMIHFIELEDYADICSQPAYSAASFSLSPDDKFIYIFSAENGNLIKSRTCIYPVGVFDLTPLTDAIIIFNPVSNELMVNDINLPDAEYECRITNVNGNNIKINKITVLNQKFTINMDFLPAGVFFLTIDNQTFKFSIAR